MDTVKVLYPHGGHLLNFGLQSGYRRNLEWSQYLSSGFIFRYLYNGTISQPNKI